MKLSKITLAVIVCVLLSASVVVSQAADAGDFHQLFAPYMANHDATYVIDLDNDGVPELLGLNNESMGHNIIGFVYKIDDYRNINLVADNIPMFFDGGIDGVKTTIFYSDYYGRIYCADSQSEYYSPSEGFGGWKYLSELFWNENNTKNFLTSNSNRHIFEYAYNTSTFEQYRSEERYYFEPTNYANLYNLNMLIPVIGESTIQVSSIRCFPAKDPWSTWITPAVAVNNKLVHFDDCKPYITDGRTLIPMRKCFELLGANVYWDDSESKITAYKDNKEIIMKIGDNTMYVNGVPYYLDVAPTLTYDRTYVPLRAISEAFNMSVEWDGTNSVVYLTN